MLSRLIKGITRWPRTERSALGAIVTAVIFYFGAFLSTSISNAFVAAGNYGVAIHASIFLVLLFSIIFIGRLVIRQIEAFERERRAENNNFSRVFALR